MKSHEYNFEAKDLIGLIGPPLAMVGIFATMLHLGVAWQLLPPPRPTLDMDRTILLHQAEASRSRHNAEVLFIGDSSCLMDVSASRLKRSLGRNVLNLASLSYLDLSAFASMIRHYTTANPARLRDVVLLCHPEFLRRAAPIEHHVESLKQFYDGNDYCEQASVHDWISCVLGVEIFKGRILDRKSVV